MATYTEKRLASGQAASTLTTVYTVPGSTVALLTLLWLYNTHASAIQTVTIAVHDGTADRTLATLDLEPGEYARIELRGLALNAGDLVKLFSTDATTTNYVLSGVEKA